MQPINLAAKLAEVSEPYSPRIVAELNGQRVLVVKLLGEFVWHHHEHEDELFLVLSGELELEFRDRSVTLRPGECLVVPRGVEHRPVAKEEVHVVLFEPASTLNTGNVVCERTVATPPRV